MTHLRAKRTSRSLEYAVSVVFSLTAVLPLLIFAYTVVSLDVIRRTQAQIGLALAVVVALLGFHLFRGMLARRLALLLGEASQAPAKAESGAPEPKSLQVPGIGAIREFDHLLDVFNHLASVWRTEAEPHLGQNVRVLVRNAPLPIAGVLTQITEDGVLIDDGAREVPVAYRRILAIEADPGRSASLPAGR